MSFNNIFKRILHMPFRLILVILVILVLFFVKIIYFGFFWSKKRIFFKMDPVIAFNYIPKVVVHKFFKLILTIFFFFFFFWFLR